MLQYPRDEYDLTLSINVLLVTFDPLSMATATQEGLKAGAVRAMATAWPRGSCCTCHVTLDQWGGSELRS
jgi:hypothetical protein